MAHARMRIRSVAVAMAAGFLVSAASAELPSLGEAEVVSAGHKGLEGPLAVEGVVFFSDVSAEKILRFDPATGEAAVVDADSGGANGLAFDGRGGVFRCEGGSRRVTRSPLERDGDLPTLGEAVVVVERFEGQAFNTPNDAIVVGNSLLFTDPRYGERDSMEMAAEGVYAVSIGADPAHPAAPPDPLVVTRVIEDLVRPNGITATADGSTVYVADEGARKVVAYRFVPGADGDPPALVEPRVLADVAAYGNPDGMAVDRAGRLYVALFETGKLLVLSPDGEPLALTDAGERTSNVCLDAEQEHAYVTAGPNLLRFRLHTDRPGDEPPVASDAP